MMERRRRDLPGLNTTSTADISFMLLVFFLLTSSMDTSKGLPRLLPPAPDEQRVEEVTVKERNVLTVGLDDHDMLTCNGEPVSPEELTWRVADFVENRDNRPDMPEKSTRELHLLGRCQVSDRHIINIQASRASTYDAYFQMQNAIAKGYIRVRNQLALARFGHSYGQCNSDERDVLALYYPQRISEN